MRDEPFRPVALGAILFSVGCAATTEPLISELSRANSDYFDSRSAQESLRILSKSKSYSCNLVDGSTLVFVGKTDKLSKCLEIYPDATVLRITSGGGRVNDAMQAAELIAERSISVEVLARCASSCGNYILPAATSVTVLPFSIVMLHGAPLADSEKILDKLKTSLEKAGKADLLDDPMFVQTRLHRLSETRRTHESFQQREGVGEDWYDLSFYYEFLDEKQLKAGFLIVSAEFARTCIGASTNIISFWEPRSAIERGLADSLVIGPTLLMGVDIPNPQGC